MIPIRPVLALSVAAALVLAACGSDSGSTDDAVVVTPAINVGRTNDPISQLMAEIYGQGLENAGYRVGRKDPVADQDAAIAQLEADKIQFFPEFTNTLLDYLFANGATPPATTSTTVTAETSTTASSTTVASTDVAATDVDGSLVVDTVAPPSNDITKTDGQMGAIRADLPATLTVGSPAGVDNGLVVACGSEAIDTFSLTTIGDLADATDLTLGGTADFQSADRGGLDALNATYGTSLTLTTQADVAGVVAAVTDKTVDCGVMPTMTPEITINGLIPLQDDKFFASDNALVPLMTAAAGQADVLSVLESINASLTTDVIRALLVKAQVDDQPYDLIAKQFLASVSQSS